MNNDNSKPKGYGPFETALIGAPVIAGGYVFGKQFLKDWHLPSQSPSQSQILNEAARHFSPNISETPIPTYLDYLDDPVRYKAMRQELAEVTRLSWTKALDFSSVAARKAFHQISRDIATAPAGEVADLIRRAVESNTSDEIRRVFNRFQTNFATLATNIGEAGKLPEFGIMGGKLLTSRSISILDIPDPIRTRIAELAENLPLDPESLVRQTRREFAGYSTLRFSLLGPEGQNISMALPMEHEGAYLAGPSMRSKYITSSFTIFGPEGKQVLSMPEMMLEEFKRNILPNIQSGKLKSEVDINRAVGELRTALLYQQENIPNIPTAQADPMLHSYQQIRGQRTFLREPIPAGDFRPSIPGFKFYQPSFRPVSSQKYMSEIATDPTLHGGIAPTAVARGAASRFDWSRLYASPNFLDWSRRPESATRKFSLTSGAREAVRDLGLERYDIFETPEARTIFRDVDRSAHTRTLFIDEKKATNAKILAEFGLGDGEAWARRSLNRANRQKEIKQAHLVSLNQEALGRIRAGGLASVSEGTVLGWESKTGKPFTVPTGRSRRKLISFVENLPEGAQAELGATVSYEKTISMGSVEKMHGDFKGDVSYLRAKPFRAITDRFKRTLNITSGYDTIITMADMRKNQALYHKQIVTAMWEFLRQRNVPSTPSVAAFMSDPIGMSRLWDEQAAKAIPELRRHAFTSQAMEFAIKEAELTPRQFGLAFGTAPTVLGEDDAKAMVTAIMKQQGAGSPQQSIKEMMRGRAFGFTQLYFGGPHQGRGVGKQGSLEPRTLNFIAADRMPYGQEIAEDLTRRLKQTNPMRYRTHEELIRSLRTMIGETIPGADKMSSWDIASQGYSHRKFQQWLEEGGGMLKVGKDFEDIYIPGQDVLAMRPFRTPGEIQVQGLVPKLYHKIAETASLADKTGWRTEDIQAMEETLETSRQVIQRQAAEGGKGIGAFKRGKFLGSKFFTAASSAPGVAPILEAGVMGVSPARLDQLFSEMSKSRMYDQDLLDEMRRRAYAGEEIAALSTRHPTIGPFSTQATRLKIVEGLSDNLLLVGGKPGQVRFKGEAAAADIVFGAALGHAMDYDSDIAFITLLDPKIEKKMLDTLRNKNNEYTLANTQHQLRLSFLKAKRAQVDTVSSIMEKKAGDIAKIGAVQTWVPKISVAIERAQTAIQHARLDPQRSANAAFLLEWLEQTPISARHMTSKMVRQNELDAMMSSITGALESTGNWRASGGAKSTMESEIHRLIKEDSIGRRALSEDLIIDNLEEVRRLSGAAVPEKLASINLSQTLDDIFTSKQQFRESGAEREWLLSRARVREPSQKDIHTFLASTGKKASGLGASMGAAKQAASNILGAAGKTAIKNYKPLALGLAGAIGIATVLSTPSETIGPGSRLQPSEAPSGAGKGASRMTPDTVHPSSSVRGRPSNPGSMWQSTARVEPATQMRIRATAPSGVEGAAVGHQIGSLANHRGSVNVNIRESKQNQNRFLLQQKLSG